MRAIRRTTFALLFAAIAASSGHAAPSNPFADLDSIRVSLEVVGVTPTDRGGTCTPSTMMGEECDDLHGAPIDLTGEWQDYVVEFGQLRQGGWGKNVAFAASDVTAVLFQTDKDVSFDIAVDDVRFYE